LQEQKALRAQQSDFIAEAAPNLAPPPGNPRFPLFDALRAIAALSVFLGHTATETLSLFQYRTILPIAAQVAYQGVAIFFLISGFLLYRPMLVARRSGRSLGVLGFAWRRVLRIVPAYWAALTVLIATGLVSGVTGHNWWIYYGFAQVYSSHTNGGIGVAWTLCIEVTFYAALPFFALAAARLGRRADSVRGDVALLVILAAASLAFRAHFHSFSDLNTLLTLPGSFCWFALGMALAVASVTSERRPEGSVLARVVTARPTVFWAAAIAASVLLYEVARGSQSILVGLLAYLLYGIVALLLLLPGVFGDTAGGLARRVLRLRALAWIGLVSYGFYLYHSIVIAQLNELAVEHHLPSRYLLVLIGSFAVTCVCAAASYYLLERPIMRLGRRSFGPRPTSGPQSRVQAPLEATLGPPPVAAGSLPDPPISALDSVPPAPAP
jgi:peptidoglycan/LPS O-acetylase OafA/YrhL